MKPNDNRYGDPALREALRRIQQDIDATPLSDGFEERAMSRIRAEKPSLPLPTRKPVFFILRRVAAVVLIAAMVGGLAYAALRMSGSSRVSAAGRVSDGGNAPTEAVAANGDETVQFDNVRLDSIVHAVARHYGREVCFRDEELRQLRLSTTWRKDTLLSAFVGTINEFDGLLLTDERDTLFVTSTQAEEEK